jgi:hypothetical protein
VYKTVAVQMIASKVPPTIINIGKKDCKTFLQFILLSSIITNFIYIIAGMTYISKIPEDAPMNPNTTPTLGTRLPT